MNNNFKLGNLLDFIQNLDTKVDKLDERLDYMDKHLAVYNTQLGFHIEGVKQAKEENRLLREYIDTEKEKLSNRIQPLEKNDENRKRNLGLIMKVLGALSLVSGIIYSALQIFSHR